MNNNQALSIVSTVVLSVVSLSACATGSSKLDTTTASSAPNRGVASPEQPAVAQTPAPKTPAVSYSIKSMPSGIVAFSNVRSTKRKTGHEVSGNAKLKTMQRHVIRLPGYIMVTLKAADGSEIESVKARYHRKFGASKMTHFEAILTTTPPDGSQVIVEHYR